MAPLGVVLLVCGALYLVDTVDLEGAWPASCSRRRCAAQVLGLGALLGLALLLLMRH